MYVGAVAIRFYFEAGRSVRRVLAYETLLEIHFAELYLFFVF